jgi:hypothetical protein
MESRATYEQAQLQLQLYDLRREARLRQARDWFFKNYVVQNLDEAMRIAAPGTEGGTFAGMVMGYWEQACALLNHGLLHEELFFETAGEFFGVWEMLKPAVLEARQRFADPTMLANLEKAAQRFEAWKEKQAPGHIAAMRKFMQQSRSQSAGKSET